MSNNIKENINNEVKNLQSNEKKNIIGRLSNYVKSGSYKIQEKVLFIEN
jgi:hypothetical protein